MTAPPPAPTALEAANARVRTRLIPFLFLLYVVSYLDRINVGFAALQMNQALRFSATTYGLGAGVFFLSYVAFEIPSNVILARIGARIWIARIMISWGIVSAATMLIRTPSEFYVVRFLLGAAEAGFFPGIIFYLTRWCPKRERARTIAAFMTATLVAGVIGGPVSGLLLSLHGAGGLAGWQWLFLLEGLPAVVLGAIVLVYLTERPEEATWLTIEEREALTAQLAREAVSGGVQHESIRGALTHPGVWLLAALYFTIPVALYGAGFWLPQIVKRVSGGSDLMVGLLSAIPYAAGAIAMVFVGRHSDRHHERRWHVAVSAGMGGLGFALAGMTSGLVPSMAALSLAVAGLASMFGPFWALATSSIGGVGAAAAIALINSVANTGGFVGPPLIGYLTDRTHSFSVSLVMIGVTLAAGGLLALAVDDRPHRTPERHGTSK